MGLFNTFRSIAPGIVLLSLLVSAIVLIAWVSAAGTSNTYEGYLGDTIDLHGVSYKGDQVYLFFTGPGLPDNGVTLEDPSLRADQGHFTIVGLDSNQQWAMTWDTFRIENQISPGTYTVYVVTSPVDKSGLAGASYQTLTVDLKNPESPGYSSSAGTEYTLNPEKFTRDSETPVPPTTTIAPVRTPPTVVPVTPSTTLSASTTTTTQKSALFPFQSLLGVTCALVAFLYRKS